MKAVRGAKVLVKTDLASLIPDGPSSCGEHFWIPVMHQHPSHELLEIKELGCAPKIPKLVINPDSIQFDAIS